MIKCFISAGEASGDLYGAELISALHATGQFECYGIGGEKMKAAGQKQLCGLDDLAVMGIMEGLLQLYRIKDIFDKAVVFMERENIDFFIPIDFPGFNIKLAGEVKAMGKKTIYYISPKVWAWKEKRAVTIKKYVDLMLSIFPFEVDFYKKYQLPCLYTGNPLVERLDLIKSSKNQYGIKEGDPLVVLMPGSRKFEIKFNLKPMIQSALLIQKRISNVQFIMPVASTMSKEQFELRIDEILQIEGNKELNLKVLQGQSHEVMKVADAGIITSGISTLEAAILKLPMAVVYRLNPITYFIAKVFVRIKSVSLANILAEEEVVPEFLQDRWTPELVAPHIIKLLEDESYLQQVKSRLGKVKQVLTETPAVDPVQSILNYHQESFHKPK